MGALTTNESLHLISGNAELPIQTRTTATWRDGSVKWVLLDFQTNVGAHETKTLTLRSRPGRSTTPSGIRIEDTPNALWIDTGPMRFSISRQHFGIFEDRLQQTLSLANEFTNWPLQVHAPEQVVIEEGGPLRACVRVSGWIGSGTNKLVQYVFRVHAFADSSDVLVEHTAIQMSPKVKMLWVKDLSLILTQPSSAVEVGGAGMFRLDGSNGPVTLRQLSESAFTASQSGRTNAGLRAPGWVATTFHTNSLFVEIEDFWQQFPKAISVSSNAIRIGLYPSETAEPFDMDQGLAKTHRFWFSFDRGEATSARWEQKWRALENPLFAQAPVEWYCNSKVFGDVAPFNFDLFPDYETLTEASGDKFIKSMATGIRNWGDVYYGGPYKGKNSYMNLEYDVPHNFLVQFARTGERKYLDAARRMAQHQADIDVNHFTKWQWKHSPRHTEIQAEFGHTFTRGLLENYFLTGNRSTFEAAVELGDYFSKQTRNPRETGNERQIGWGLISLLPVYEATWDRKYLGAASETVERLAKGQDAKGKFNIRWDNRIAFMNGIAATGFIYYEGATGDPLAAEAALRTIRRTKGFYPEYAGRTLEALAWAYQRTREPEYLDLLKRTYETTMARQIAWNTMELGAPTIFTVHTLPFLEQSGLVTKPKTPLNLSAAQFASQIGLHVHHVPSAAGDLYLQIDTTNLFRLALVRKGAWKADATAELYDPAGRLLHKWSFGREPRIWQREDLELRPSSVGTFRLAMRSATIENVRSGSYVTWDIATSRPLRAVMQTPGFTGLQFVTPSLCTTATGDADKIELELVGEGEGFKKAVVYDPNGNVAGTMEAFIDLGDAGRYSYKLTAPIDRKHVDPVGIWRISLQDVVLTKLSGLHPYFATSPEAYFHPDRN